MTFWTDGSTSVDNGKDQVKQTSKDGYWIIRWYSGKVEWSDPKTGNSGGHDLSGAWWTKYKDGSSESFVPIAGQTIKIDAATGKPDASVKGVWKRINADGSTEEKDQNGTHTRVDANGCTHVTEANPYFYKMTCTSGPVKSRSISSDKTEEINYSNGDK